MKAILIMGSTSDEHHAKKITDKLDDYGIAWEQHAASAHKEPLKVLEILKTNKNEKDIVQSVKSIVGEKGADYVIECAGSKQALNDAIMMTNRGGKICLAAFPHKSVEINIS